MFSLIPRYTFFSKVNIKGRQSCNKLSSVDSQLIGQSYLVLLAFIFVASPTPEGEITQEQTKGYMNGVQPLESTWVLITHNLIRANLNQCKMCKRNRECLETLEKKGCDGSPSKAMKIKPNDSQNKRYLPEAVMGHQEFLKLGVYKTHSRDLLDKRFCRDSDCVGQGRDCVFDLL